MLIDKTLIAANMFAAESNIRPNLAGVYITPIKEFVATNSFIACKFKPNIKEKDNEFPDIGIKDFELEKAILIPIAIIDKIKFKKSYIPILERKILGNLDLEKNTIEIGETDLNREIKIKTRINKNASMPVPSSWIPAENELNIEVGMGIEFLETILKALKMISAKGIVPSIRMKIKADEKLSEGKMTTLSPIIFELENQKELGQAIIMPIKISSN